VGYLCLGRDILPDADRWEFLLQLEEDDIVIGGVSNEFRALKFRKTAFIFPKSHPTTLFPPRELSRS
jgi:hypothetical protein